MMNEPIQLRKGIIIGGAKSHVLATGVFDLGKKRFNYGFEIDRAALVRCLQHIAELGGGKLDGPDGLFRIHVTEELTFDPHQRYRKDI